MKPRFVFVSVDLNADLSLEERRTTLGQCEIQLFEKYCFPWSMTLLFVMLICMSCSNKVTYVEATSCEIFILKKNLV